MRTSDLKTLRANLSKEVTTSFIKEDDSKIRSFANFINIVSDKDLFTDKQLEFLAVKYRDVYMEKHSLICYV